MKTITSVLLSLLMIILTHSAWAIGNSIVAVDKDGVTGQYSSLVLDQQGYPTISYYDVTEGKLKIVHCFEKNCALFNAIVTPDAANNVGEYTALTLDHNGKPVVSYYDGANSALKILHCGNSACSIGNTIATPDANGTVGQYTAITIDNNNFPVASYYDATKGRLKVLHCGNEACTAGNNIAIPDNTSSNGVQSSIVLNTAGNPVVAYFDFTNSALKILTCGNAKCSAGNTITTADSVGDVGRYPSLTLDSNGNPAVSYLDLTNGKLKILRCGNKLCTAGNTIASVGNNNNIVGYYSSLALDVNNNPMVSFYDRTQGDLDILRCGNAACSSNNIITPVETIGNIGLYTSIKLDSNGNPVVSYFDATQGDLKLLHCGSAICGPNTIATADNMPEAGRYSSIQLDPAGKPVVSYLDQTNGDLKLLHCGDTTCTSNNLITAPDTPGNTGWDTSLALDANSYPVISLFENSANIMKVIHCNNPNCSGASNSAKPDVLSHRHTSLALDSVGHPVVASSGQQDQGLRLVHCGDVNCSANNTVASPDFPAFPFQADVRGVSLVLDTNGNPIVSFYRADKNQLKLLHCADPACNGPGNAVTVLDPGAVAADHRSTSVTLDTNGNPIIAYQDSANMALKVLHCGNANCTSGNTISPVATGPNVGVQPAIKLDANGNPIVSFGTNTSLSVLSCGNATCTANNKITAADPTTMGVDSALTLDAAGNPVVSYYSSAAKNLKVLHCGSKDCG